MIRTKIGIVVLHWNNFQDTSECIKSIKQLKDDNYSYTTVVVDNGSTNDSFKRLKKEFRTIVFIHNEKNLGFAGGNNKGIEYFKNKDVDFLFILNNDTILSKNTIEELIKTQKNTKADIVSPKIYFSKGFEFHSKRYKEEEKGKVLWYAGGAVNWNTVTGYHVGVDEVDHGQYNTEREIEYATGAALFITKKAIVGLQGFDERYFLYYEDIDFSMRAKKAKYTIFFSPDSIVWHNNAGGSASGSTLQDYYITRNRLLFGLTYASFIMKMHLCKEAFSLFLKGRKWQKKGVRDFVIRRFGKGSYE